MVGEEESSDVVLYKNVEVVRARMVDGEEEEERNSNAAASNDPKFQYTKNVNAVTSPLGTVEIEIKVELEKKSAAQIAEMDKKPSTDFKHLDFKMVYVANPMDEKDDQLLETIELGPVEESGSFVFRINDIKAPNYAVIKDEHQIGTTLAILNCSYRSRVFANIGFFVQIEYDTNELNANPPQVVRVDRLVRNIAIAPTIKQFPIEWQADDAYYEAAAAAEDMEESNRELNEILEKVYAEGGNAILGEAFTGEEEDQEEEDEDGNDESEECSTTSDDDKDVDDLSADDETVHAMENDENGAEEKQQPLSKMPKIDNENIDPAVPSSSANV